MQTAEPRLVQLGARIPAEMHRELKQYSERTGIPMARLVRDAIHAHLRQRTRKEV